MCDGIVANVDKTISCFPLLGKKFPSAGVSSTRHLYLSPQGSLFLLCMCVCVSVCELTVLMCIVALDMYIYRNFAKSESAIYLNQ